MLDERRPALGVGNTVEMSPRLAGYDFDSIMLPRGVTLEIVLAPHGNKHDLVVGLRERLLSADILIPEAAEWDSNTLKTYQRLSNGDYNIYQKLKREAQLAPKEADGLTEFDVAFGRTIYNTRCQIVLIDTPRGMPSEIPSLHKLTLITDANTGVQYLGQLAEDADLPQLPKGDLTTFKNGYMTGIGDFTRGHKSREDHLLTEFGPRVEDAISKNKKLSAQRARGERIHVVMTIGGLHTFLGKAFREKQRRMEELGIQPDFEIIESGSNDEMRYSHRNIAVIRSLQDIPMPVEDEIWLKVVMGSLIEQESDIYSQDISTAQKSYIVRMMVDLLSEADSIALYDKYSKGESIVSDVELLYGIAMEVLDQTGAELSEVITPS